MPIILSFDVESTGLDKDKDRVIEVGSILYSTVQKKQIESAGYLVKSDISISEEITDLTGISPAAVERFGYNSEDALDALLSMSDRADYWVGQNVLRFDKIFLENWCKRHNRELKDKLWIDIRTDLPGYRGKHLQYAATDHNFLNLFPHSALSDCQTVLKILEFYDFDKVVERAKQPSLVVRSHQAYEDNKLAKNLGFRWIPEPLKIWAMDVKEGDITDLQAVAPFKVTIEKDIPLESIWY